MLKCVLLAEPNLESVTFLFNFPLKINELSYENNLNLRGLHDITKGFCCFVFSLFLAHVMFNRFFV